MFCIPVESIRRIKQFTNSNYTKPKSHTHIAISLKPTHRNGTFYKLLFAHHIDFSSISLIFSQLEAIKSEKNHQNSKVSVPSKTYLKSSVLATFLLTSGEAQNRSSWNVYQTWISSRLTSGAYFSSIGFAVLPIPRAKEKSTFFNHQNDIFTKLMTRLTWNLDCKLPRLQWMFSKNSSKQSDKYLL